MGAEKWGNSWVKGGDFGGGGELFDFLFLVFGETLKHSGQVPGFQSLRLTSSGTSSFLICKIGIIVILTF